MPTLHPARIGESKERDWFQIHTFSFAIPFCNCA
jgi:hypothetical protein